MLERRQKELKTFLLEAKEPPSLPHPNIARHYHVKVDEPYAALQENSEEIIRYHRRGEPLFALSMVS